MTAKQFNSISPNWRSFCEKNSLRNVCQDVPFVESGTLSCLTSIPRESWYRYAVTFSQQGNAPRVFDVDYFPQLDAWLSFEAGVPYERRWPFDSKGNFRLMRRSLSGSTWPSLVFKYRNLSIWGNPTTCKRNEDYPQYASIADDRYIYVVSKIGKLDIESGNFSEIIIDTRHGVCTLFAIWFNGEEFRKWELNSLRIVPNTEFPDFLMRHNLSIGSPIN